MKTITTRRQATPKHQTPLDGSPYEGYVYSYPHKTAYRTFSEPLSLKNVWKGEDTRHLFLYAHIPFCEMRCGFCNLFTTVNPKESLPQSYLVALRRQAEQVREALDGKPHFARIAVGGGTPTYLTADELDHLFVTFTKTLGAAPNTAPTSVETSPETATPERLSVLQSYGVSRVSMGVQSFFDQEVEAIHRRQEARIVEKAIETIRDHKIPTLNLDLMYGLPHQTPASWAASIRRALEFQPEEIFLYPLYVRPLTRMGLSDKEWDDTRLAGYRQGRDLLLEAGYQQHSMRMFRAPHAPNPQADAYKCQEDGMVGLGCGARSYTHRVHYSSAYAVGPKHVKSLIRTYAQTSSEEFAHIKYGVVLPEQEQKVRHLILSLLFHQGLSESDYQTRFQTLPTEDHPQLQQLQDLGLAQRKDNLWTLTPRGFEYSDAIGPWLFSEDVRHLMHDYDHR